MAQAAVPSPVVGELAASFNQRRGLAQIPKPISVQIFIAQPPFERPCRCLPERPAAI